MYVSKVKVTKVKLTLRKPTLRLQSHPSQGIANIKSILYNTDFFKVIFYKLVLLKPYFGVKHVFIYTANDKRVHFSKTAPTGTMLILAQDQDERSHAREKTGSTRH